MASGKGTKKKVLKFQLRADGARKRVLADWPRLFVLCSAI